MDKIRKMDELENNINQSSIKVSYLFTTIFLVVWSLYDIINGHKFSLAGILICINILVLLVSRLIFSKKYELLKNKTYINIAIGVVFVMAAIIFIGFFLNH